jgi:redox-sensitive bicupin YhaK (pirin superfamily)
MSNNFRRRDFMSRLTLGAVSMLTFSYRGFAKSIKENFKAMNQPINAVISIKPMGFQWETADPFLFCVHHEDKFPKGNAEMAPAPENYNGRHIGEDFIIKDGWRMYHGKKVPGFPGHPHRGFETITVVIEGIVDHADSLGAAGRYGNGDVQWMTAGKGVQHSEMFPLIHQEKENPMELFQIWLNLPKKDKMVEPHFKMLWAKSIPKKQYFNNNKSIEVEIIAGKFLDTVAPAPPPNSWASKDTNEVAIWNIKLDAGATFTIPKASKGVNRNIYFYTGNTIKIANENIENYHAVEVLADVDIELINGNAESKLLVLQGKPIGEHVIQYGPFVMNTKDEINQAFEDYHRTQFGGWPWPRPDQIHPRNEGRFALHADGRKELGS